MEATKDLVKSSAGSVGSTASRQDKEAVGTKSTKEEETAPAPLQDNQPNSSSDTTAPTAGRSVLEPSTTETGNAVTGEEPDPMEEERESPPPMQKETEEMEPSAMENEDNQERTEREERSMEEEMAVED